MPKRRVATSPRSARKGLNSVSKKQRRRRFDQIIGFAKPRVNMDADVESDAESDGPAGPSHGLEQREGIIIIIPRGNY